MNRLTNTIAIAIAIAIAAGAELAIDGGDRAR